MESTLYQKRISHLVYNDAALSVVLHLFYAMPINANVNKNGNGFIYRMNEYLDLFQEICLLKLCFDNVLVVIKIRGVYM